MKRKTQGRDKKGLVLPIPESTQKMPENYESFLISLKERIRHERIKTVMSANSALVLMYWGIGNLILEKQNKEGWGAKVIDRLSDDLKIAFPEMSGFSPRNLKYMRKFAESWPDFELVQRTVALIPWRSEIWGRTRKFSLRTRTHSQKVSEKLPYRTVFGIKKDHLSVLTSFPGNLELLMK